MHNVEFMPRWYPVLQRRRFVVFVQCVSSGAILLALIITMIARRWDIRSQKAALAQYEQQIHESNKQLGKLDDVVADQRRLRAKEREIARLGVDVDTTRVISTLEDAMPAKMALTGLSVDSQDDAPLLENRGGAATDRWLNVRLQGVSPTDIEVAILLDRLSKLNVFDDVAMSYIRDRTEAGHTMRDFELKFKINLSGAAEGKS